MVIILVTFIVSNQHCTIKIILFDPFRPSYKVSIPHGTIKRVKI